MKLNLLLIGAMLLDCTFAAPGLLANPHAVTKRTDHERAIALMKRVQTDKTSSNASLVHATCAFGAAQGQVCQSSPTAIAARQGPIVTMTVHDVGMDWFIPLVCTALGGIVL